MGYSSDFSCLNSNNPKILLYFQPCLVQVWGTCFKEKTWADTVSLTHGLSFVNVTWTPEIGVQLACGVFLPVHVCRRWMNTCQPNQENVGRNQQWQVMLPGSQRTWQEMNWDLNLLPVSKVDSTTLEHFLSRSSKSKETLASNSRETHVETYNKKNVFVLLVNRIQWPQSKKQMMVNWTFNWNVQWSEWSWQPLTWIRKIQHFQLISN